MSCSTSTTVVPSAVIVPEAIVDVADDDRRQPERQLIAQQKPRVGHQRPADRRHLLLSARQIRRRQMTQFAQSWKQIVDASADSTGPAACCGRRAARFSSTERLGNSRRPSGAMAIPSRTISCAVLSPIGWPSNIAPCPGAVCKCAGDGAQKRGLAGAIGADDGDCLALLDRDVDVEQRLEVAIEGRQILGLQQRHDTGMPM